jgi:hypothetical protein
MVASESPKSDVRIGQEVFVLSRSGEVVRTMIAKLEEHGYRFLNGDREGDPHWFTFEDAIAAANLSVSFRQAVLRKELRVLAQKRRALKTQEYKDSVINAPYRVVDLRDPESSTSRRLRRTKDLKKVHVPDTYFTPGSVVYAIITPLTRLEWGKYRPHKHFVLETEVVSVCFSPDGKVHYLFSTPFAVEEFYSSRKEAVARLESFSEPGSKDPVYFISSKQEKEELRKFDDPPF